MRFLNLLLDGGWLLAGVAAVAFAAWIILRGPRIVSVLILKYLRKRRIAWVSLAAVILCTAMVLVVISVMGGWLRMFRQSFHGLSGDVLVQQRSMAGFPNYEQMIEGIEALPEVGAGNAVPVISTFGLVNLNNVDTKGVQVFGYPIEKIGNVNDFPMSLYRQGQQSRTDAVELSKELIAERKKEPAKAAFIDDDYLAYLALKAKEPIRPPSFALLREAFIPLDRLPDGVTFPAEPDVTTAPATQPTTEPAAKPPVSYDAGHHWLIAHDIIYASELADLLARSADSAYQQAMKDLALKSRGDVIDYRRLLPKAQVDVMKWPGMIGGTGVLDIHKDKEGKMIGRGGGLYRVPVKLTVLGISPGGRSIDLGGAKSERNYWIVDDSRTKVYQYDSRSVYVPFDVLQKDLGMDARSSEEGDPMPARVSDIDIKVKPGFDLNVAKKHIEEVVNRVQEKYGFHAEYGTYVQTWEESQKTWLGAIEKEKVLVTGLFGLISVVAVFLIFCIFYMIVVEKTRDIGIVKSVGATSGQVAGIFLGYGLAIGLVGAGMGFLAGYLVVHNINFLHAQLGKVLGIVIWDPEVYAFDTIPNTMNPPEVAVILGVAIISAVLGALVPAIRAARLHPVEALRWE